MLGVFIALLIAGWKYFISHQTPEAVFLSATNFLFWWFVITSIILAGIYLVIALGITEGGAIGGASAGGLLGGILGFVGGGALSFIILFVFAIARGLLIFSTYLIHHSLIMADGNPEWNTGKLVLGIILFLIGLTANRASSSSSSSSSN